MLDANGIVHTGAGRNIDEAHKPAIVERKGVKIGFLQYTGALVSGQRQIATATEPGVAKIASRRRPHHRSRRPRARPRRHSRAPPAGGHPRRLASQPRRLDAGAVRRPPGAVSAARTATTHSEEYQKPFAHVALDAGADLVFGHGTHTVQGVEVYNGKPILYAIGHSKFDQPGYENSKDGLVVRVVIDGKRIPRVSFVPVTRDAKNDV